jgi:hypothetical protein
LCVHRSSDLSLDCGRVRSPVGYVGVCTDSKGMRRLLSAAVMREADSSISSRQSARHTYTHSHRRADGNNNDGVQRKNGELEKSAKYMPGVAQRHFSELLDLEGKNGSRQL